MFSGVRSEKKKNKIESSRVLGRGETDPDSGSKAESNFRLKITRGDVKKKIAVSGIR